MEIKSLSKLLGIEVSGIDLKKDNTNNVKKKLNKLFIESSVLVIRNQNLDPNEFYKSAEIFGEIFKQHNSRFSLKENNKVHYISNKDKFEDGKIYIPGEGFHTDHSNDLTPPKATILHAKKIPSYGGDTQFVNMNKVFESFKNDQKKYFLKLKATHVYQSKYSKRKLFKLANNDPNSSKKVIHPIVRTHPETGLKSLYINPIRIENIEGESEENMRKLIKNIMIKVKSKKFEYRHKWRKGDFVIWDNRILMHKANGDYDMSEDRYLYRIMLKGDRPYL